MLPRRERRRGRLSLSAGEVAWIVVIAVWAISGLVTGEISWQLMVGSFIVIGLVDWLSTQRDDDAG